MKLNIAEQVQYPFFVVSYDEAGELLENDRINIAHGIVGDCMKSLNMQSAIDQRVREIEGSNYSAEERDDLFRDVVIDVETELEFEWNPLIRAAACSMTDALDAGMESFSITGLTDPPMPPFADELSAAEIRRRVQLMFSARRHGAKVTAEGSGVTVTKETWVRNVEGPGVHGFSIVEDVAKLITFREFARAVGKPVTLNRHWQ